MERPVSGGNGGRSKATVKPPLRAHTCDQARIQSIGKGNAFSSPSPSPLWDPLDRKSSQEPSQATGLNREQPFHAQR